MKKTLAILAMAAMLLTTGAYSALACGYCGYGGWHCPWTGQTRNTAARGWGCGWYGQGYQSRGHMGVRASNG